MGLTWIHANHGEAEWLSKLKILTMKSSQPHIQLCTTQFNHHLGLGDLVSVISRNPKSPVVAICTTETSCNNTAQHLSIYLGLHPLKFVLIIDFSDQDRLPSGQFLVLAEDFWNILLHNLEIIEILNAYTIYTLMGLPMLSMPSVSATWCGPPGAAAVRGN